MLYGVSDTEHPCSMATQVAHSEHPCSMPDGTVQEGLLELSRVLPPLVCLVTCKPCRVRNPTKSFSTGNAFGVGSNPTWCRDVSALELVVTLPGAVM